MTNLSTKERLHKVTEEIYAEMNKSIKNEIKIRDLVDTQRELQMIVNNIERRKRAY